MRRLTISAIGLTTIGFATPLPAVAQQNAVVGNYTCLSNCNPSGGAATVTQTGDPSSPLKFKNEQGNEATGGFKNRTVVFANGWSGGNCPVAPATADIDVDNESGRVTLNWCTGSVWRKN